MSHAPRVEDVKKLRDERQIGLVEAKAILTGRHMHSLVDDSADVRVLREILHALIDKVYPQ